MDIEGEACRFCQLCGRFHGLEAFDNNRRSCRERLARHNNRRRQRLHERDVAGGASKRHMPGILPGVPAETSSADSTIRCQHAMPLMDNKGDTAPLILDSYQGLHCTDMQLMTFGQTHNNLVYLPVAGALDTFDLSLGQEVWGQPLHSSMIPMTANHIASLSQAAAQPPVLPHDGTQLLNPFLTAAPTAPLADCHAALLSSARQPNKPPRPASWPQEACHLQTCLPVDQLDLLHKLSAVQAGAELASWSADGPMLGTARSSGSVPQAMLSGTQAMGTREDASVQLATSGWSTATAVLDRDAAASRPYGSMGLGMAGPQRLQDMRVLGEAQTLDALWRDIQLGQVPDGSFAALHTGQTGLGSH